MVRQLAIVGALMTVLQCVGVTGAQSQVPKPRPLPVPGPIPVPNGTLSPQTPEYTAWGHVTALETGWSQDTMSITLDPNVPFVNGSIRVTAQGLQIPCKFTNAGYALDPADLGIKVHEAALLSAFAGRKWVRLLVLGCVFDKPKVIGVGLSDEHPP